MAACSCDLRLDVCLSQMQPFVALTSLKSTGNLSAGSPHSLECLSPGLQHRSLLRSLPLSVANLDDHDTTLRFRRRCLRRTWWRLWRSSRRAADRTYLGDADSAIDVPRMSLHQAAAGPQVSFS